MSLKIGFLQDFNILAVRGGAEMNDAAMFQEGLRRGHKLTLFNPDTAYCDQDAVIISNCVSFDRFRLKNIINSTKVVWFFHDYIFCRFRLFYPVTEQCKVCGYKNYWLELFKKAKLLIWLSQLHREMTLKSLPELENIPYALIPSAIDPDPFLKEQPRLVRKPAYLSVNTLYEFKGRQNILRWAEEHPQEELHILSDVACYEQFGHNVTILPPMPYDMMPSVYSEYQNYLELPSTPQPFNRTVVEAKLSGCKVHTNALMGCASWDWFDSAPVVIAGKLKKAPEDFWRAVEGSIK